MVTSDSRGITVAQPTLRIRPRRGGHAMPTTATDALTTAAEAALRAPSIFNTQPWRWRVGPDILELSADPDRQLPVTDPDHRLTTLSCGIALHHARTALAAEGRTDAVDRLPDPARPDLLSRIRITGHRAPTPADIRRYQATLIRHTDRRLFTDQPVSADALGRLRDAAEGQGAHLYLMRAEDIPALAAAVSRAQTVQSAELAYRSELAHWTREAEAGGSGVPADTATPPMPRVVPVREFGIEGTGALAPGTATTRRRPTRCSPVTPTIPWPGCVPARRCRLSC
ncbi:Acg family FMN-binding oxidoreductase [Planosporangium sp. 12N6]|uniref:Acg family FMN-binding oxidoreductase n=1 Tax=Planosporangium spinosum TaxID=3402278 RepID=UPI003CEA01D5